jgi:hypothetical protein
MRRINSDENLPMLTHGLWFLGTEVTQARRIQEASIEPRVPDEHPLVFRDCGRSPASGNQRQNS